VAHAQSSTIALAASIQTTLLHITPRQHLQPERLPFVDCDDVERSAHMQCCNAAPSAVSVSRYGKQTYFWMAPSLKNKSLSVQGSLVPTVVNRLESVFKCNMGRQLKKIRVKRKRIEYFSYAGPNYVASWKDEITFAEAELLPKKED